ncbi:MAG: glycosyltransferase family 4 protein [Bacteroidota bacterium]
MILLSHSGKQHSYQLALALHKLGRLERFYTSSYITSEAWQKKLEAQGDTFWSRRFISGLPAARVNANWRFEIPELVLRRFQGKSPAVQEAVYRRDVNFDRYMARRISRGYGNRPASELLFWGFQGSCHSSLQAANQLGWISMCELATAHVTAAKRILGEEAALHPEWAGSIDNLVFPAAYEKRLVEEPHLAAKVIAASEFTRQTLLEDGVSEEKISVLPLGADIGYIRYTEREDDRLSQRPLRLIYAGTVTQRKGIFYLLEAMKGLDRNDVELHLIGGVQGSEEPLKKYAGHFIRHGAVSQKELFERYTDFDALVLPTVFEGFGLVIVEAMAAGLPVITTPHSIGPELITEGKNGYIVPVRDIPTLKNAILKLRTLPDEDFLEMRKAARDGALAYSWGNYMLRLEDFLKRIS